MQGHHVIDENRGRKFQKVHEHETIDIRDHMMMMMKWWWWNSLKWPWPAELETVYRSGLNIKINILPLYHSMNDIKELDCFFELFFSFRWLRWEVSKIMRATPCATTLDLGSRWMDAFWPNTRDSLPAITTSPHPECYRSQSVFSCSL